MKQTPTNKVSLALSGALLVLVVILVLATYDPGIETGNELLEFMARNHEALMVFMALLAVGFGYYASDQLYGTIRTQEREHEETVKLVLGALGRHERLIIEALRDGPQTQAELASLDGLGRVQVHRALQRLEAQGLVVTEPRGRTKHVRVAEPLAKH